jgi:hypothetical protein
LLATVFIKIDVTYKCIYICWSYADADSGWDVHFSLWSNIQRVIPFISHYVKWSLSRNKRNVSGSTQVPVPARNNARKGTVGLSSPVKLERCHLTYNMLVWRKTQNKQTKYHTKSNHHWVEVKETSVVLLMCPFLPEIMHRRAPEVFLHQ